MKKCETFGCSNPGHQMYQIAPGTNVWLCKVCIQEAKQDEERDTSPRTAPRKAA